MREYGKGAGVEFLYYLEGIRNPALDAIMSAVTWLGTHYVVLAMGIVLLWCISKRQAYFMFAVTVAGTLICQWLKLIFCIPRPWVLDPNFSIVESARAAATGFSFPSIHTQCGVGAFGALAISNKQRWLRILCVLVILIVPLSRMYLGVHTPLDVGVGFLCAVALVVALWPCFNDESRFQSVAKYAIVGIAVLAIAYAVWVNVSAFPADVDEENLFDGIKNGWTLLGCMLGLALGYFVDREWLHFEVKAPLPGQILKVVLGLALMGIVLFGVKALQGALDLPLWTNVVRYFLAVAFATSIWPMTFPFFAKVGTRERRGQTGAEAR